MHRHAVLALCLLAPAVPRADGADNLELTVEVVASLTGTPGGTVAAGSGQVDGRPDGLFTYANNIFEFGAPVAANRDVIGFVGAAELVPQPPKPSILRGIWGDLPGISTVAIQTGSAPGTTGGYTGVFGPFVIDFLGDVAFSATWEKTSAPTATGSGIWYSDPGVGQLGVPVPVALSGQDAPGTGTQFGAMYGVPLYQSLRHIGFVAGVLGNWTFEKATQQLRRVGYVGMPVEAFGSGVTLTTAGTILGIADGGQVLLQAAASDGKTHVFLASAPDAVTPILASGDAAPGLPNRNIGAMTSGLNETGDVVLLTRLDDGDGNLFNDTSALYLHRSSGAIELVTHGGEPLAGMPSGLWGGTPMINSARIILLVGLGTIDPSGGPGSSPVFTAVPAIPVTPSVPTTSASSFNSLGQIATYIQETNGSSHSLWFYQPGEGWSEIATRGGTLMIEPAPAAPTTVAKIGVVLDSSGSDGRASSLTNDGRLVFSINGRYILAARFVAPDYTVNLGEVLDFAMPVGQVGTLTNNGGTVNFQQGVNAIEKVNQTAGSTTITGNTTITDELSFAGGTLAGSGTTTVAGPASFIGDHAVNLRHVVLQNITSVQGVTSLIQAARIVLDPDALLRAVLGWNLVGIDSSDVRLTNHGTFQNGELGDLPDTSTLLMMGVTFEQSSTGSLENHRTFRFGGPVFASGSTTNFGNMSIQWQGTGAAPESFFDNFDNRGELTIGDSDGSATQVGFDILDFSLNATFHIRNALVDIENATPQELEALRLADNAELIMGTMGNALGTALRLLYADEVTVSGSGNSITADQPGDNRSEIRYGSGAFLDIPDTTTALKLHGTSLTSDDDAITTNTGNVAIDLTDSDFRIGGTWTIGGNVSVNLLDDISYFGTTADFTIPSGQAVTVIKSGGTGTLHALPGSDVKLGGTLNGNLRIKGALVMPVRYYSGDASPSYFRIGQSPGLGVVNGNVTLRPLSYLACELAGAQQGVSYDHLDVNGVLNLSGGQLDVRFLDGFEATAQSTDLFVLVEANAAIAGAFVNWPSGTRRNTADGLRSFELFYGPGSPHGENRVVATNVAAPVAGASPPAITTQPVAQNAAAGASPAFTVAATGNGPFTYQWYRDGIAIAGATGASYTVPSAQAFLSGQYSVVVTDSYGATLSNSASLNVTAPPVNSARLLNLSTRAASLTGDNVLIPGFVIAGSGTKKLLIRGVGPTLGTFGVGGVLADPLLTLKRTVGTTTTDVATNDNWGTASNLADLLATTTAVGAFDLGGGSADAALLVDLEPGQYSVVTEGVGGGTGIAIVELYDADLAGAPTSSLINISTRGFVGTGEQVMIPGFVISSEGPKTLLIRAVGPTLADFNVSGTLADPRLVVNRTEIDGSNTPLLTQDNWGDNPGAANTATVADQVGAFPLTTGSADAAFVITLPPGVYTVVGSSADFVSTGIVLVEVYVVP